MDTTTIATLTVAAVAPYLKQGISELSKGIGKDLWETIKKPFTKDSQKKALEALKENPNDKEVQTKVISKLEDVLEDNPDFANELKVLLEKISKDEQASIIKQNTLTVSGNNSVGIQDVQGGSISINTGQQDKDS